MVRLEILLTYISETERKNMNKVIEQEIDKIIEDLFQNIYNTEESRIDNVVKYFETCDDMRQQINEKYPELANKGMEFYLVNIITNKSVAKYVIEETLKRLFAIK